MMPEHDRRMRMISLILFVTVILAAFFFFTNSYASRKTEGIKRKLHQAKTNVSMGVLFVAIGAFQLLLPVQHWFRLMQLPLDSFGFAGSVTSENSVRRRRKNKTDQKTRLPAG